MKPKYEGYVHEIRELKIGGEAETWYEFYEMSTGNYNLFTSQEELMGSLMNELDRAKHVEVFHAIDRFRGFGTVKPITDVIRSGSPSLKIQRETTFLKGESKLLASLQEMAVEALSARAQEAPAQSA